MFVLFNRFQLLSKSASNPFSFPYLFFLHRLLFLFFILPFSLLSISCEKSTAPVNNPQVTLTAEYLGVSEAELILKTKNTEANTQYQLFRDDSLICDGTLIQDDTIITDTLLLPAHSYTYKAQLIKDGTLIAYSQPLQITTMDTTSHDFTWETFTFGTSGSSVLHDVAVISPDNIWCVGEVYADSAQPWLPYNAVHWDGQQWELKRVPTNSVVGFGFYPLKTVFAFDSDNIWMFSDAGSYCHWNGSNWESEYVSQRHGGINKIWGSSPTDIYFVGTNGNITYYDGQGWQKLESGIDLPIQDIWGITDLATGEPYILCPASDKYNASEKKLLKINVDKQITELPWPFTDRDPYSTWFKSEREIYICGGGVIKRNFKGEYKIFSQLPRIFLNKIRGNDINDIFVVGDFGLFAHYNGKSWWVHPNSFYGTFSSVDVKGNTVVAVGEQNAREGLVMVIKRN